MAEENSLRFAVCAAHFIRYTLGNATDLQLANINLTTKERDALLSKPVTLSIGDNKKDVASFSPKMSFKTQSSWIESKEYANPYQDDKVFNIISACAHEHYHAAKFWSGKSYYLANDNDTNFKIPAGLIMLASGALTDVWPVAVIGAGIAYSSYLKRRNGPANRLHAEECGAARMENFFNGRLYDPEVRMSYNDDLRKVDAETIREPGYPSMRERVDQYNTQAKEILTSDPATLLFPGGMDDYTNKFAQAMENLPYQTDLRIQVYQPKAA